MATSTIQNLNSGLYVLYNSTINATKTKVSTYDNRSIAKADAFILTFVRSGINRASTFILKNALLSGREHDVSYVDAAGVERWIAIWYADDTHIYVQTSQNDNTIGIDFIGVCIHNSY